MPFWPNESGRFNVLHLDDGHPLQVMGEDLQTSLNVPQIAEQHSGQLSQVFTYGSTPGRINVFFLFLHSLVWNSLPCKNKGKHKKKHDLVYTGNAVQF